MSQDAYNNFKEKHPFILNSILMVLAAIALFYIGLLFIDVFTSHGQERTVPDVRTMTLDQAVTALENAGFEWDISDSTTFNEQMPPGVVVDQDPKAGATVKAIRVIYLKVNALHPRGVQLPRLQETSIRQALAKLRSMGFKSIEVDSVASPYGGLILQVQVNGHSVAPGTSVGINSHIKLTVGDGSIDNLNPDSILDSHTIDSIEQHNYEQEVENYKASQDERKSA
ncbi:MAG: PASTA domain-containing protein [Muribaculaceae bacterium]|nr:PASTA domain-containing protein [Muribaculaceae bacterium]MBR1474572.1 PASTA domain-containing protein [Muribaculaceae bacterium]